MFFSLNLVPKCSFENSYPSLVNKTHTYHKHVQPVRLHTHIHTSNFILTCQPPRLSQPISHHQLDPLYLLQCSLRAAVSTISQRTPAIQGHRQRTERQGPHVHSQDSKTRTLVWTRYVSWPKSVGSGHTSVRHTVEQIKSLTMYSRAYAPPEQQSSLPR